MDRIGSRFGFSRRRFGLDIVLLAGRGRGAGMSEATRSVFMSCDGSL